MVEKIVLDAGHGGRNPGATYQGRRESDDALRLAVAVGNILEENGYDVIYTRTTDATQSVGQKAAIANGEPTCLSPFTGTLRIIRASTTACRP